MRNIFSKFKKAQRLTQLLILLSFLASFSLIRLVTHLQKNGILPTQTGDLHIHHMVPGIILIIVSGYMGMSFWRHQRVRFTMAVLFGIGAALTIDEFALWLFLNDVYWEKQGRLSVDAFIIVAVLLFIVYSVSEVYGHRTAKKIPIISRFIKQPRI